LLRFVHRVHRNENRIVNGFPGERIPVVRPSWAFDSGRQRSKETMQTLDRYDRGDSDRQRSEATTAGLNVPT
jgi:hypothetical protein